MDFDLITMHQCGKCHFQFCLEIFENVKHRDDHSSCDKVEITGRVAVCHRHPSPIVFK